MRTFDLATIELGAEVRTGSGALVRLARRTADGAPLLATCTGPHVEVAAASYAGIAGIAPLAGCGRVTGARFDDLLVEELPPGAVSALARAPLPPADVLAIVRAVAAIVAPLHAAGETLDGIHPALIYVDAAGAFAALAPRGPRFVASAAKLPGEPVYDPYVGHEVLALGQPARAAGDVFALCGAAYCLATGRHPFGDSVGEIMMRVIADDAPIDWPAPLAHLARGLAADPTERPAMAELR